MAVTDYSAQIAALTTAIGSGATSISYEGKSITYRSLAEMIQAKSFLEREQARLNGTPRPVAGFAAFGRGYQTRGSTGMLQQRADEDNGACG